MSLSVPTCYTLGRFIVYKRDTPWRCIGKTPRKPLELLKAMVALGSRDVNDTKLIQTQGEARQVLDEGRVGALADLRTG